VERWHFKIICSQIEEDAISLPSHTMMVKLFMKYGLFTKIEERETPKEPDFRPHGEEW